MHDAAFVGFHQGLRHVCHDPQAGGFIEPAALFEMVIECLAANQLQSEKVYALVFIHFEQVGDEGVVDFG